MRFATVRFRGETCEEARKSCFSCAGCIMPVFASDQRRMQPFHEPSTLPEEIIPILTLQKLAMWTPFKVSRREKGASIAGKYRRHRQLVECILYGAIFPCVAHSFRFWCLFLQKISPQRAHSISSNPTGVLLSSRLTMDHPINFPH